MECDGGPRTCPAPTGFTTYFACLKPALIWNKVDSPAAPHAFVLLRAGEQGAADSRLPPLLIWRAGKKRGRRCCPCGASDAALMSAPDRISRGVNTGGRQLYSAADGRAWDRRAVLYSTNVTGGRLAIGCAVGNQTGRAAHRAAPRSLVGARERRRLVEHSQSPAISRRLFGKLKQFWGRRPFLGKAAAWCRLVRAAPV